MDVRLEVYTFWDLGVDDSTTIWFMQFTGMQVRVIDYYEATGYGFEHYAKELKAKPYVYGEHYMPHDASVRELSSGEFAKSRQEVAEELGIKPIVIVERARDIQAVITGIGSVRNILSDAGSTKRNVGKGFQHYRDITPTTTKRKKQCPTGRRIHGRAMGRMRLGRLR
jgi:hypothetical protein